MKRQLTRRGIAYEPLDNGIRSSAQAPRVQQIADGLDAAKIDAVFRKWLRRLPHPFAAAHRAAGYRYQRSILQAEFALTQVLGQALRTETTINDTDDFQIGRALHNLPALREIGFAGTRRVLR